MVQRNGDFALQPQYQKIKQFIVEHIDRGEWEVGHRVPSDNELAAQFEVSRMTANRAMRELTDNGVLTRIAGVGTFVAEHIPQTPLLEIQNIAIEIEGRGHQYSALVHSLEELPAPRDIALELEVPTQTPVFRSMVVHLENGVQVQLEDRWVNASLVPDYISQDFSVITPNAYLMEHSPLTEVEHVIEAIMPDAPTRKLLKIDAKHPCLLVHRRTWSGPLVSTARLIHPGNRYRMGGRFVPVKRAAAN
jgi:GntR family histidine utilization transcriptional repressor